METEVEGIGLPDEVMQRTEEARQAAPPFQFFPAVPPRLMPYLASQDEFGNTAIRPGPLIPFFPLEPIVQGGKYWLSEQGLRYSLVQSFTGVSLSDVKEGNSSLGFYALNFKAKWAVLDAPGAGTAGWLSTQVKAKNGLDNAGDTQSPKSNLGTVTAANYNWSSLNGVRVPELAWQQSLRDGEVVVLAGMVSQRNYLDGNAEAHTANGEFMNSALVHSQVLRLAQYNFGLNLQWQPTDEWYAMLGASAGQAPAGFAPWTDFTWNEWSLVGEFGFAPKDVLGLGPGVYRIQPFVAQVTGEVQTSYTVTAPGTTNSTSVTVNSQTNSPVQAGLGFNFQQQLGRHSPFAWFGRFGFSGSDVAAGAAAQVGTGFVLHAPLKQAGLVSRLSNDLLGVGFVWSQPSVTTKTTYHQNEYILESFYTLQLTPTVTVQPDLQVVWNPAFNSDAGPALVGQLQVNIAW